MNARDRAALGPEGIGARLCRFCVEDETPLVGFYLDEGVIPIDQTSILYAETEDVDLIIPATDCLLDLLPPDGEVLDSVRTLACWLATSPEAPSRNELVLPHDTVTILTPIANPGKILLLAGNYAAHVREQGREARGRDEGFPHVFMKPPTTLNHAGGAIRLPAISPSAIDWECELGVVIGQTCRNVSEENALDYVAGYTIVNDISDRGFRPNPERSPRPRDEFFDWLHGKWHDTFCPVGPCILAADAGIDPQTLAMRLLVNGQVRQDASTAQMTLPIAGIIAYLSQLMTLEPGDLIATGTPSGVGHPTRTYLRPGDLVEAEIEAIGRLVNPVEAA